MNTSTIELIEKARLGSQRTTHKYRTRTGGPGHYKYDDARNEEYPDEENTPEKLAEANARMRAAIDKERPRQQELRRKRKNEETKRRIAQEDAHELNVAYARELRQKAMTGIENALELLTKAHVGYQKPTHKYVSRRGPAGEYEYEYEDEHPTTLVDNGSDDREDEDYLYATGRMTPEEEENFRNENTRVPLNVDGYPAYSPRLTHPESPEYDEEIANRPNDEEAPVHRIGVGANCVVCGQPWPCSSATQQDLVDDATYRTNYFRRAHNDDDIKKAYIHPIVEANARNVSLARVLSDRTHAVERY